MTKIIDNQNIDRDFLDQLSLKELMLLRRMVKQIHMKFYPEELFTNDMADMLISKFGNEYGEKLIKQAVDNNL